MLSTALGQTLALTHTLKAQRHPKSGASNRPRKQPEGLGARGESRFLKSSA
jgi:hypothetical protein